MEWVKLGGIKPNFYMKTASFLLFMTAIMATHSCTKKKDPLPEAPVVPRPGNSMARLVKGHLLKAVEIAGYPVRIEYAWHTDSSLRHYHAINTITKDTLDVDYHYTAGKLTRISTENSLSEGVYVISNDRISRITSRHLINPTGRQYDFTYRQDSLLSGILRSGISEAGLRTVCDIVISYDGHRLPAFISSTQPNGVMRAIRIHEWSNPFSFSPWVFSDPELNLENYELYNPALLFQLDRLPVKFSEWIQQPGGSAVQQRRWEITYTIQNDRLMHRTAKVFYPADPQLNSTIEHTFYY